MQVVSWGRFVNRVAAGNGNVAEKKMSNPFPDAEPFLSMFPSTSNVAVDVPLPLSTKVKGPAVCPAGM